METLSVIICTLNPRFEIFSRCLHSISEASKYYAPHEILIIDNNSDKHLSEEKYITDFLNKSRNARICVEEKPGLTPARLRGIREAVGDLLVFIDDDNFIRADFFVNLISVSEKYKQIGSWSGQVKLEFEETPPLWTKRYWGLLVHREFAGNYWSNLPHLPETMPCGAGLVIRRAAAEHYFNLHKTGQRKTQLDRTATSLFSAGDNDLAACACDIGLGVGLFDSIVLYHYIPKNRTTKTYLLKLAEGIAHSGIIFRSFRGEAPAQMTPKRRIANVLRLLIKNSVDREFQQAVFRGERKGRSEASKLMEALP